MPRTFFYLLFFFVLSNLVSAQIEIKNKPLNNGEFIDLLDKFKQYQIVELNTKENYHQLIKSTENEVASLPEAEFTANITTGCTPLTVQFTDLSTGEIDNRDWSFPGGNPSVSSEMNPLVIYETAGTYDVSLVVSNSVGTDEMVKIGFITVIDRPIANFTFLPDMLTVAFQNTSQNADSLSWNFGDGVFSDEANPSHTYANEGMFTVTLIAINDCASDTIELDLNLQNSPSGGFGSDKQVGCSPLEIQFFDQSSGAIDTWEWTFEGGFPSSSNVENPIVVFNLPGMYDVTLITTNSSGADTTLLEDYITVLDNPIADFSFEVFEDSVSFNNLSQFADSYIWIFNDGDSSTLENPSHIFEEPGIYNVELIAINECGEDSQVFKVTPAISPTANFSIVKGNGNGCVPFIVEFSDDSGGAISTWNWTFEGGDPMTSNTPNPTVTYNNAGVFKVSLIVANQFGIDTIEMDSLITVANQPQADFTFEVDSNTVTFQNTSSDGLVYIWDYGDGIQIPEFENTYTYESSGDYNVELIAVNSCGFDTINRIVSISPFTSIKNELVFEELSLFPNPNNGQFQLQIYGLQAKAIEVTLLNVLGQNILQRKLDVNNESINEHFNLNSNSSGVYLLRITEGNKMITKRVVVY